MSNKKYRGNPANPDYINPVTDTPTPEQPVAEPPATETASDAGTSQPAPGEAGKPVESPPPPGQPAPWGAGKGYPDLRYPIRTLMGTGQTRQPLTEVEVAEALSNCVMFCQQLVLITSRILETVPLGEVRQLVAGEMAMAGAVVTQDGTLLKPTDLPPAAADPAKRPRGTSHPLVTLIKLAMQAVRLLRQITFGTHPEVTRKLAPKLTPEEEESYDQIYKKMGQYLSAT